MIVFYLPNSLEITHIVSTHQQAYVDFLNTDYNGAEKWVQTIDDLTSDQIALKMDESGVVIVFPRSKMPLVQNAQHITGIPQNTVMTINNSPLGVMDASGEVELTFPTPGTYKLALTHPHYFSEELTFETHL